MARTKQPHQSLRSYYNRSEGRAEPLVVSHSSFFLFSKLSTELRLQIWTLALPSPREILVNEYYRPRYNCSPPALLSVNQESRYVAQHFYRLCVLPNRSGGSATKVAVYIHITPRYDHITLHADERHYLQTSWVKGRPFIGKAGQEFEFSSQTMTIVAPVGYGGKTCCRRQLSVRRVPAWQRQKGPSSWDRIDGRLVRKADTY